MKTILVIAMCFCLVTQGCSTRWIDVALQDLPILINLLTEVANVADPALQKDIQEYAHEATIDLQLVKKLVDEYNVADKATKATTLGKITTILSEVSNHLNSILNAAHVVNNAKTQHIVEAVTLALLTVNTLSQLTQNQKAAHIASLPSPQTLRAELLALRDLSLRSRQGAA